MAADGFSFGQGVPSPPLGSPRLSRSLAGLARRLIGALWIVLGPGIYILSILGSCHKRQKAQAPTPQAPIRCRQTRKVTNAKVRNRNTNLT